MVDVKPLATIVQKWITNASAATQYYQQGATAAANKWAADAGQAEAAYDQGVQASIARQAFSKGVQAAGPTKYAAGITTKGVQRYGPGVQAGQQNFSSGMQGVINTLQSVQLPPRGPRGSPQNLQRVAAIDQALFAARTGA